MDATGVVKELHGEMATVIVRRESACDSCASGASCKGGVHGTELEAHNPIGAEPGDSVRISFKAFTYLKGSLLVYGIPAVALIAGAVFGKEVLTGYLPSVEADLVSAIGAFGFLGISILFLKLLIKRFEKNKDLEPVIEEIIGRK
jgi:sigma-E factor negative regulatory protein RseC